MIILIYRDYISVYQYNWYTEILLLCANILFLRWERGNIRDLQPVHKKPPKCIWEKVLGKLFQELVVDCDNSAEGRYFKVWYSATQNIVLFSQKSAIPPSVEREFIQGFAKKEASANMAFKHTNTFSILIFF